MKTIPFHTGNKQPFKHWVCQKNTCKNLESHICSAVQSFIFTAHVGLSDRNSGTDIKRGSNYSDWACYAFLMNSRKFISPLLLLIIRMEIFFKVGEQRSVLLELQVKENSLFLFRKYAQIRAQASYFEQMSLLVNNNVRNLALNVGRPKIYMVRTFRWKLRRQK